MTEATYNLSNISMTRAFAIARELTQIDQRVQYSPDSHPDMRFLQGAQVALSWVLYPGIFSAPIEHLRQRGQDRLANWLKVSG